MDVITPQKRIEMLADYQHLRQIGRRLSTKLVKSLDKEALDEAGSRLGILRRGILCFDTEDTMTVFMDYALHHIRRDGINAVARYLADSPPLPGSEEMRWLQATCRARYSLLQVEQTFPGFALEVRDICRDEKLLLLDIGLSQTAPRHAVLASHLSSPGEYWMTTGAALPVAADTLAKLSRQLERRFGRKPADYRALSPEQETQLATLVIRTCLEDGMSQHARYTDVPSGRRDRPHALPAPKGPGTRRNDPCPCGSGRKFKNCCRPK